MCISLNSRELKDYRFLNGNIYIFNYNDTNYFFKACNKEQIHRELIMQEFASLYGINHVNYELANIDGTYGVLSKDTGYITLAQFGYKRGYKFEGINNNIEYISKFYENIGGNYNEIKDYLYSIFIFDMLIGNGDRHSDNLFADEHGIGPIFDNAPFFNYMIIGVGELFLDEKNDLENDLRVYFFKYAHEKYIKLFFEKLELFNSDNIEIIFNDFKEKYKGFYDQDILDKIKKDLIMNIDLINRKLYECIKIDHDKSYVKRLID